ncbi:hypothetical protein SAMN05660473_03925 [Arthrobacter sp. 49Tsu3.1M3]|nr:hypothetical protein SAMN05660473_03925 [Arthrobacter sp. 49Tsu3.1M3]
MLINIVADSSGKSSTSLAVSASGDVPEVLTAYAVVSL